MRLKILIGGIASLIAIFTISNYSKNSLESTLPRDQQTVNKSISEVKSSTKIVNTCDGIVVTKNCVIDGIKYSKYLYHPAVPEISHIEKVTTYEEQITGYCTLCNDGTYSPSCATGRGACSHHGGVAEWNAPRYSKVPVYSEIKVVDSAPVAEYVEKLEE